MRKKMITVFGVFLLFFSCAPKEGGKTVTEVFEAVKTMGDSYSNAYRYIVPDERIYMIYTYDFTAGIFAKISGEKSKAEYQAIRKKHQIPPKLESGKTLSTDQINDLQAVIDYGRELYADVKNPKALMTELENFIEKYSNKKETTPLPVRIKNIQKDEGAAFVEVELENGKTDTMTFKKIKDRWYVSLAQKLR